MLGVPTASRRCSRPPSGRRPTLATAPPRGASGETCSRGRGRRTPSEHAGAQTAAVLCSSCCSPAPRPMRRTSACRGGAGGRMTPRRRERSGSGRQSARRASPAWPCRGRSAAVPTPRPRPRRPRRCRRRPSILEASAARAARPPLAARGASAARRQQEPWSRSPSAAGLQAWAEARRPSPQPGARGPRGPRPASAGPGRPAARGSRPGRAR
mmetsp:Transcript_48003/g.148169  ORF Transcript_48003/g.148169 Transcript_48003/m.148169 type:complete len:212 (-) Transcript_48003:1448-2083(-)